VIEKELEKLLQKELSEEGKYITRGQLIAGWHDIENLSIAIGRWLRDNINELAEVNVEKIVFNYSLLMKDIKRKKDTDNFALNYDEFNQLANELSKFNIIKAKE